MADNHSGSMFLGMLICWLLNLAQMGIAFLLLVASDKMLPTFYTMVFGVGLIQIAYIIPLYRLLNRSGKARAARGLLIAAGITLLINALCAWRIFPFPR